MKKPFLAYVLDGLGSLAILAMIVIIASIAFLDYTWSKERGQLIFWGVAALALFTAGFIVKKLDRISREKHPTEGGSR